MALFYSCYALVNNTGNELVIFPGIALKTDNKSLLLYHADGGLSYMETLMVILDLLCTFTVLLTTELLQFWSSL